MANHRRGEVESDLFGEPLIFCLTLGALADIEAHYAGDGLATTLKRFASGDILARDMIIFLGAAARGGGASITNDDLARRVLTAGLDRAYALVARLLAACFDDDASSLL